MSRYVDLREVSRNDRKPLTHVENSDLMPLPAPFDSPEKDKPWASLSPATKQKCECGLDDTCALNLPQPFFVGRAVLRATLITSDELAHLRARPRVCWREL